MKYDRAHDVILNAVTAKNLAKIPGFAPSRESHVRELLKIEEAATG
jgi:hypothetical protein